MNEIAQIVDGTQHTAVFSKTLETFTFTSEHINFHDLLDAISNQDTEEFKALYSVVDALNDSLEDSDSGIEIVNGEVCMDGEVVHGDVCDKILEFARQGIDFQYLVNFLTRLQKNPSKNSVDQLFKFLQHRNIAIGPDGRFWAYKSVRSDYRDKYSGKFDNSIGSVCKVPRNQVDDNPDHHCSQGFHVGSLDYAGPGGWYNSSDDNVMIVAVDPADAVSVPGDHSFQKLRVCKYEVIGEYARALNVVESSLTEIGGIDNDPEDLELYDFVTISVKGTDYVGKIHDMDDFGVELMGVCDGVIDIFSIDFDEMDMVTYHEEVSAGITYV
jgi:hypothetical protein